MTHSRMTGKVAWVVTPGFAGMEKQACALAEALQLVYDVKRVRLGWPWRIMPFLCRILPRRWILPAALRSQPLPDIIISCGGEIGPIIYALCNKNAADVRPYTIHIQGAKGYEKRMHCLILPQHDALMGDNVILSQASLHAISPAYLASIAPAWKHLRAEGKACYAILVGGDAPHFRMHSATIHAIAGLAKELVSAHQGQVHILLSRRTRPAHTALCQSLCASQPGISLWPYPSHPNPYEGLLAMSDMFFVTQDSINMISEAVATGKPVYVLPLKGFTRKRHIEALRSLVQRGWVRLYEGRIAPWHAVPEQDLPRIAEACIARYDAWCQQQPAAGHTD